MLSKRWVFVTSTIVVAGLLTQHVSAGVIYQTGFEAPTFAPGALGTQGGWDIDGSAAAATIVTGATASGSTFDGTQALRVAAVPPSVSYTFHSDPVNTSAAGAKVISASFAMKINDASTRSSAWGGEVFDSSFSTIPAEILVTSQGALVASDSSGVFPVTANGLVARNTWHTFELRMNYATTKYRVYLDGSAVTFTSSGTPYTDLGINVGDGTFGELDLYNSPGSNGNDNALFDAFSVTASAVPEPTSIAAVIALAGLIARRR